MQLRKFQNILLRSALLTIYKCFVRTHLDYDDIIYDQAFNNFFHQKIESLQYNAALAIKGAIGGASREKMYQELGLESLQQRRWCRKLCLLFKVYKNQCPKYLFDVIPRSHFQYRTRNAHNTPHINVKHQFFKKPYFPSRAQIQTQFSRYIQSTLQLRNRSWNYFSFSPFMSQLLWENIDPPEQN